MSMVVLQVKENYAAVLKDDGSIQKIFNDNYYVGQVLANEIKKTRKFAFTKPLISVAAVFIFVVAVSVALVKIPTTFISLDVNPSIEYECNLFNRIVGVNYVNDDAKLVIGDLKLDNLPIDFAVNETISALKSSGYLSEQEKEDILLSCASILGGSSQQLLNDITQMAKLSADSFGINADIVSINATMTERRNAIDLKTTAGKLALVEQYNSISEIKTMEQTQDMLKKPVREIVMSISAQKQKNNGVATPIPAKGDKLVADTPNNEASTGSGATVKGSTKSPSNKQTDKSTIDKSKDKTQSSSSEVSDKTQTDKGLANPNTFDISTLKPNQGSSNSNSSSKPNNSEKPSTSDKENNSSDDKQNAPDFGLDSEINDNTFEATVDKDSVDITQLFSMKDNLEDTIDSSQPSNDIAQDSTVPYEGEDSIAVSE